MCAECVCLVLALVVSSVKLFTSSPGCVLFFLIFCLNVGLKRSRSGQPREPELGPPVILGPAMATFHQQYLEEKRQTTSGPSNAWDTLPAGTNFDSGPKVTSSTTSLFPRISSPQNQVIRVRKLNWLGVASQIPIGNSVEDKERRNRLWKKIDRSGNGYAKLDELQRILIALLPSMGDYFSQPIKERAVQSARLLRNHKRGVFQLKKIGSQGDFIDKKELRRLLAYISGYLELWKMFDKAGAPNDQYITKDDYDACVNSIMRWGLEDFVVDTGFKQLDPQDQGVAAFDDFTHWAHCHKLDITDQDNPGKISLPSGLKTDSKQVVWTTLQEAIQRERLRREQEAARKAREAAEQARVVDTEGIKNRNLRAVMGRFLDKSNEGGLMALLEKLDKDCSGSLVKGNRII